MKIILIRHGQTDVNAKGLTHILNDASGLNSAGKKQVEELANYIQSNRVEIIYSSPEIRAEETSKIISKKLNIKYVVFNDLRERNWGDWNGKPWTWIKSKLDNLSTEERYFFCPPNGESWKEMDLRIRNILTQIMNYNYTNVAIVTHVGILRAFMPIIKNESKELSFEYTFDNASISIFEYIDNVFKEIIINNTSFLK